MLTTFRMLSVVLAAAALLVAACGGGDDKTPTSSTPASQGTAGGGATAAEGRKVFASAGCTSCHTLADAGSSGTVGPNLDDLKPSQDAVASAVSEGRGVMPSFKGKLSDAEISAVAEYVSSVAGG